MLKIARKNANNSINMKKPISFMSLFIVALLLCSCEYKSILPTETNALSHYPILIPTETMVFISEKRDNEYYLRESLDVFGCFNRTTGGLILADVNFDGRKDILVSQGLFGTQALVRFACFLGCEETYELNESFSNISNPALDTENRKILSTWRNWAASHSWAMYSYENGEFIETIRLTSQPEEIGPETTYEIFVWQYIIEILTNGSDGENVETEVFLTMLYSNQ